MAIFADFLKRAALNIPVTIGQGDVVEGHTYVEDASDLIVKLCDVPTTKTRIFNAIEGVYTPHQIVEIIRKINPQAKVTLEAGHQEPIYKRSQRPRVDITGVRTELGWQPKYGMEAGIRKVLNYFRQKEGMPQL